MYDYLLLLSHPLFLTAYSPFSMITRVAAKDELVSRTIAHTQRWPTFTLTATATPTAAATTAPLSHPYELRTLWRQREAFRYTSLHCHCVPLFGALVGSDCLRRVSLCLFQSLQSRLDAALEAGDVSGSGLLAQQIAQFKQQLRAQRQQVASSREREKEEREWESAQLVKINAIKAVVEERRRETELVKSALRQQLTGQRHSSGASKNSGGNSLGGSAASSFFSVFSSKDSHSHGSSSHNNTSLGSSQSPLPLDEVMQRARKSIKETQVTLEKQTLIVDSVDMNEHPTTLHAGAQHSEAAPLPSAGLSSIKAIRKDTVQLIQSHLSHVDELERHIDSLDACLSFLNHHIAPPSKRAATSATYAASSAQRNLRQQQSSGSGPMR